MDLSMPVVALDANRPLPLTPPEEEEARKRRLTKTVIVVAIAIIALLVLALIAWALFSMHKKKKEKAGKDEEATLVSGMYYACKDSINIYQYINGKKNRFADKAAYVSYGSPPYMTVDCSVLDGIPDGMIIPAKSSGGGGTGGGGGGGLPAGIAEGGVYKCDQMGGVYLISDGKRRLYADVQIYISYGSPPVTVVSCEALNQVPLGENMPEGPYKPVPPAPLPTGFKEGGTYRCLKDMKVYTIENGLKRWYPSTEIYKSYGSPTPVDLQDCTQINNNILYSTNYEKANFKYPSGIAEGYVVKCNDTNAIYLIQNGKKRWFATEAIYALYGSPPFKVIDCNTINSIPDGPIVGYKY